MNGINMKNGWRCTLKTPSQSDPLLREHLFEVRDPIIKDPCFGLKGCCGSLLLLFMLIFLLMSCWYISITSIYQEEFLFTVEPSDRPSHITSDRFVSFGFDTSLLGRKFGNFNLSDEFNIKLIKHLAPAHLRFGGTMADRLLFLDGTTKPEVNRSVKDFPSDGGSCSYEGKDCKILSPDDILIMTSKDWIELATFAKATGLSILFDLNVLLRNNDLWEPGNARELIKFSDEHEFEINWQLGNEPNSFKHVFGTPVNADQLAADYKELKEILSEFPRYANSFVTGPETTRPLSETSDSVKYMKEFLINGKRNINVLSWHQYYMNGREAVLSNFIDPNIFNLLYDQIIIVKKVLHEFGRPGLPIWMSETGSAYGGGAPGLSNTFAGSFIYLDKLGLAAQLGIDVVIRQSLYGGYYTMISEQMKPLPDWWIAVLYKTFVGKRVLHSRSNSDGPVRLYAHCTPVKARFLNTTSITVFGMNLKGSDQLVRFNGVLYRNAPKTIMAYHVAPFKGNLQAVRAVLNGVPLELSRSGSLPPFKPIILDPKQQIYIPKHSIIFWVFHGVNHRACL